MGESKNNSEENKQMNEEVNGVELSEEDLGVAETKKLIEEAETEVSKNRKIPPVRFEIFYGAHGSESDSKGLEELFKDTDLFIVEQSGWDEQSLAQFRDLALKRLTPEGYLTEYYSKQRERLINSGIIWTDEHVSLEKLEKSDSMS